MTTVRNQLRCRETWSGWMTSSRDAGGSGAQARTFVPIMAACSDGDAGQVKKPHPLTARSLFQHCAHGPVGHRRRRKTPGDCAVSGPIFRARTRDPTFPSTPGLTTNAGDP